MGKSLVTTLLLLFLASFAAAQRKPKSHEECIKQVPGDWGPNFGDEWRRNEALYWACRLRRSAATVRAWQRATGETGMADDIKLVTIRGQQLVVFVEMEGTAHCFDVKILRRDKASWILAWKLPSTVANICTGTCPALRADARGEILTIEVPVPSDPNEDRAYSCRQYRWSRERFRWNGSTFEQLDE